MRPVAALLADGKRLHLQHGPIDLIIGADGQRELAFEAARTRFETVLKELVAELDILRAPVGPEPCEPIGETAQRMMKAARACAHLGFVTPMAAVAGAVAETVLAAMTHTADLSRAYVNNGGDIAFHLSPCAQFKMAMSSHDGSSLGRIEVTHDDPVRGIATSGRHGRSLSMGIADSVTTLAVSASAADVSATLISNAVDLPGHPAIHRAPADTCQVESDLGKRFVVTDCGSLSDVETAKALNTGHARATHLIATNQITAACLFLHGQSRTVGPAPVTLSQGAPEYA